MCLLLRWYATARYGGPAVLQMGEQPDAELRDQHDVVIKVYAAALNPVRRACMLV